MIQFFLDMIPVFVLYKTYRVDLTDVVRSIRRNESIEKANLDFIHDADLEKNASRAVTLDMFCTQNKLKSDLSNDVEMWWFLHSDELDINLKVRKVLSNFSVNFSLLTIFSNYFQVPAKNVKS